MAGAERAGRRGAEPATVLLWGFVTAVALWTVAAPWWSWPAGALRDPTVALAVLGVGVLGTLLPFFLAVGAVRAVGAAAVGIAATFEPVFAAALAWLLLGQRLGPAQLAGGGLVVAGVALAQLAAAGGPQAVRFGRRGDRDATTKVEVAEPTSDPGSRG
jgi:drug/metabolite transporter (DMT)-like permease